MSSSFGLSVSFRQRRMRFRTALIESIGSPEYIHLMIDSKDKRLYIQSCERDKDAFRIYYSKREKDGFAFYLTGKSLMEYLAHIIGVNDENTIRYYCVPVDSETVMIELKKYEVLAREQ